MVHRTQQRNDGAAVGDAVGDAEQEGHDSGDHAAEHIGRDPAGSRAADGIALGDPHQAHGSAALPASSSLPSKMFNLRPSVVAIAMPSGATGMAQAMAPMNWVWPEAISPTENGKATLFTGPPMSNPAMPPSTMPSSTRLPPLSETSIWFIAAIRSAIGAPMTKINMAAMNGRPVIGAIRIGHQRLHHLVVSGAR